MLTAEEMEQAGHVNVNAGRLWAGGVATAIVAALAGVLITPGRAGHTRARAEGGQLGPVLGGLAFGLVLGLLLGHRRRIVIMTAAAPGSYPPARTVL